jgi:DNA-binding NtrC family response regulator
MGNRTRSEVSCRREPPDRPRAWLFHVLSWDAPTAPIAAGCNLDDVDELTLGRGDPGSAGTASRSPRLEFSDPWMSTTHARIERSIGGYWLMDAGSKNGLLVNGERIDRTLLVDGDWIEAGHTLLRYRRGALPLAQPGDAWRNRVAGLESVLPTLQAQYGNLEEIARSTLPVVLRGETGTGKELVARAVHRLSGRPGELISVNCGALPATLLESELFGYRKGAFSNAVEDRLGLVRAADRGTLFLDEIGDLPLSSQAALLRVLQENEVMPLGSTRPIKVDLRVISATHRDLEAQVALGQFRSDLYARLAGHTSSLPPLRERREDLGVLTATLLRRIAPDREVQFEPAAVRALYRHDWPLNVRELEKVLTSAVVLARRGAIGPEHLNGVARAARADAAVSRADSDRTARREQLAAALQAHRGNVSAAARALGKARSQVQRWIRDYQLDPAQFQDS